MSQEPCDHEANGQVSAASLAESVPANADSAVSIPVVSESFAVTKCTIATGQVRVLTTVREHEELVDEPLVKRTVSVTVVPINTFVEGTVPLARQEGDLYIVPVLEERLVVEKRLFLKEEIHVRTEQQIFHEPQSVVLRQSVVSVERAEPEESH